MKTTALLFMFVSPVIVKDDCCPGGDGDPVDSDSSSTSSVESDSSTDTPTQADASATDTAVDGTTSVPDTSSSDGPNTTEPTTGDTPCGDGVVDAGEECDGSESCHECKLDRIVFNTGSGQVWSGGQLGGMPGADEKCNTLARTYGLDGPDGSTRFRAWLSSETSNIAERNIAGAGRYVRVDGVVVADSWTDLLAGKLVSAPRLTADGVDVFDQPTWTGTLGEGGVWGGPSSCDEWSTNRGAAVWGIAASNGPGWSEWQEPVPCSQSLSLYCVEQPDTPICDLGACKTTADCPFGTECFPLVNGIGTLVCGLPCKTDAACESACTEGPVPVTSCGTKGLCEPTLCDESTGCDCQPWFNGVHVCMN